jgi:hypothetical protein
MMSPPTTYLKLPPMLYKMCVASALQIEEFHRELKQLTGVEACVFVAKPAFNPTTLPVPCSFGVGSSRAPT